MTARPRWSSWGYARVVQWLVAAQPHEGCAVGLGAAGRVRVWVRIANIDPRPHRFEMDPGELAGALGAGARFGLAPLVFVHSHVGGRPEPSALDRSARWAGGLALWPSTWTLVQVVDGRNVGPRGLFPPAPAGGEGC